MVVEGGQGSQPLSGNGLFALIKPDSPANAESWAGTCALIGLRLRTASSGESRGKDESRMKRLLAAVMCSAVLMLGGIFPAAAQEAVQEAGQKVTRTWAMTEFG